ncbi:MAG: hypothetical protein JXB50_08240 [Spirochaetes bacterium]|nr:hypothetical protein [Spirochaetota bacterium]
MKKRIIAFYLLICINIFPELKFEPVSLYDDKSSLFCSIEKLAGRVFNKTLFYGFYDNNDLKFESVTFYPEKLFYSSQKDCLYIQNRMGLYLYDFRGNSVNEVGIYPGFSKKDEYIVNKLSEASFSPDFKFLIAKVKNSNITSDIYLFDLERNNKTKIIDEVEILPGVPAGCWSDDSNYFLYQKNGNIYYFSLIDFQKNKLLSEELRIIGKGKLSSTKWTQDSQLIWVEDNLIYKADSRQFYSRSIYSKYLRQGNIIGKINFDFDPSFDYFRYNDICRNFILVQNFNSIYYNSLDNKLVSIPYLKLNEKLSFNDAIIFDTGEGIILIDELSNGKVTKKILLIVKINDNFIFKEFNPDELKTARINDVETDNNFSKFVVSTSKGAFCYNFSDLKLLWKYDSEEIVSSCSLNNGWVLGGVRTTLSTESASNTFKPLFASSFTDAGFVNNLIGITTDNKNYIINKNNKSLTEIKDQDFKLNKNTKSGNFRLLSRDINKGFYKNEIFIKDLYSGEQQPVIGEPILRYQLYQPESLKGIDYFKEPNPEKHEIALVFDCIQTAEGIYQILTNIDYYNITASFFINGTFMEINPLITKEMVHFNVEMCNMFQYYVNLVDTDFFIDKNFIRQGLSSNEEYFFKLTGKNFSPFWHSPKYAYNETLIQYGKAAGYKFVIFNIDSYDWVGMTNTELSKDYYMSSSEIIKRIVENIKPGQIIAFNVGKNSSVREDWLFNNMDLLISELVRSGYTFTTVSDIMKKYRKDSR